MKESMVLTRAQVLELYAAMLAVADIADQTAVNKEEYEQIDVIDKYSNLMEKFLAN